MGCDIHVIAEVKKNGKWEVNKEEVFINPYYKEGETDYDWQKTKFQADPDGGRSYDWFAILADVRNGFGFAGVSTGDGFDVVAQPKGLPDDLSSEGLIYFCDPVTHDPKLENEEDDNGVYYVGEDSANKWVNEYGCKFINIDGQVYVTNPDYHSDSYITVDDFDNFDWNQMTMKYGVISLEQYKNLKDGTESPQSWSGRISGPGIVTVDHKVADKILKNPDMIIEGKKASELNVHVDYEWPVNYREWFAHKIERIVEPLRKLKETNEDARIVFTFDN